MKFTGAIRPPPEISQQMFNDSDALKALKTDLVYIHANFSFLIATHNEVENDVSIARNNKINNRIQDT